MGILASPARTVKKYQWSWQGRVWSIAYEVMGAGPVMVLLPAFSTVSSRSEVGELAELLSQRFQTIAVDWPGFGESDRLPVQYNPVLYQQFLQDFLRDCAPSPYGLVATGHGAGYALRAKRLPLERLILVAPTWRGPLPAMAGGQKPWFGGLRGLVRLPLVGQALYGLNTTRSFLRLMYRRHVYADGSKITPELIVRKQSIAQAAGARFAPVAFVTGGLDPVTDRSAFQECLRSWPTPVLVIMGAQSPPKSWAEMQAMASLEGVDSVTLPGTLGMAEESAPLVAAAILDWTL